MPDAGGRFKGISVPELPWLRPQVCVNCGGPTVRMTPGRSRLCPNTACYTLQPLTDRDTR